MSDPRQQLIALGAVFESAALVDKLARTGQISEAPLDCMLGSLLARNPASTLTSTVATASTCATASKPWPAPWSASPAACSANRCATPWRC